MKDVVLAVSPLYLSALFSMIKQYSNLSMTGSSDAEDMAAVVPSIPIWSICGFTYLSDFFRKSDDRWTREIIYSLNAMFSGVGRTCPVVFVTKTSKKQRAQYKFLLRLLSGLDVSNLTVYFVTAPYISDTTLNRDIFGTILLHSRELRLSKEPVLETPQLRTELHMQLPFNKQQLSVLSPLASLIELDPWFSTNTDKLLEQLRRSLYTDSVVEESDYPKEYSTLIKVLRQVNGNDTTKNP